METAIRELRGLRTAGVDDPSRVVELGARVLVKGGHGAAGDECTFHHDEPNLIRLDNHRSNCGGSARDGQRRSSRRTFPYHYVSNKRNVLANYLPNSQLRPGLLLSWECNLKCKRNL
jgi:hypothetical protein